jgi:hypothetical protein
MVTATPMEDVEAAYGQGREEQLVLDIMCDAALTCRERHAYMPATEEERRNFVPHLWVMEGASEYANHAYAEGRMDEAEEHSMPLLESLRHVQTTLASNIAFDMEGVPEAGWDAVAAFLLRDIDAAINAAYSEAV